MRTTVFPILHNLRDIYRVEGVMPRFKAYLSLMLGSTHDEPLPLGVFSPMGSRQSGYLDALIAMDAEGGAAEAAAEAAERLTWSSDHYRVLLVIADVARNGWTERHLTDAEWRIENKYDELPKSAVLRGFDRWVTVQLWTDVEPTAEYVRRETQSSVYRASHRKRYGAPKTLAEMMRQEGMAMAFAGSTPKLDEDDIDYTREVLRPFGDCTDFPTCFAALYGDEAARAVGLPPLGLSAYAGFDVGLANAIGKSAFAMI